MNNTKRFLLDMGITIPITLVVAALVTFAYSLTVHGSGAVDWETSFFLALLFGIVLPVSRLATDRKAQT